MWYVELFQRTFPSWVKLRGLTDKLKKCRWIKIISLIFQWTKKRSPKWKKSRKNYETEKLNKRCWKSKTFKKSSSNCLSWWNQVLRKYLDIKGPIISKRENLWKWLQLQWDSYGGNFKKGSWKGFCKAELEKEMVLQWIWGFVVSIKGSYMILQ